MDIIITNSGDTPIYEQLYNQIKNHIISGSLDEGDGIPSIRNLAKDLRISVVTTKKAYDELERDGFINTIPGKGSFVAPKNTELLRETRLREIEKHMQDIADIAPSCGLSEDELIEMFQNFIGG